MATGLGILFWDVSPSILGEPTYLAMAIFGLGSGVMSGKLGAITQSCVPENHRSSAAGLQCTALNFGAAMGVSILGSIMIAGLAIGMQGFISAEPTISNETREITGAIIARGIPMLTTAQAREAIVRNGIPSADHEKILALYAAAESRALEWAVAAAAALALLTAGVATLLPGRAKPSPTPGLFPVPNSKQGIS